MNDRTSDGIGLMAVAVVLFALFMAIVIFTPDYHEPVVVSPPIELKSQAVPSLIIELDGIILDQLQEKQKQQKILNPVRCLTDNIYFESAFEPYEGQLAVAQVTLNRAHGNSKDICQVVYFKKVNPETGKKEAAFSWTLGKKWKPKGINHHVYQECQQLAKAVLTKHLRSDIIDSSVEYYHADYVKARWDSAHEKVVQIGAHIFYR